MAKRKMTRTTKTGEPQDARTRTAELLDVAARHGIHLGLVSDLHPALGAAGAIDAAQEFESAEEELSAAGHRFTRILMLMRFPEDARSDRLAYAAEIVHLRAEVARHVAGVVEGFAAGAGGRGLAGAIDACPFPGDQGR